LLEGRRVKPALHRYDSRELEILPILTEWFEAFAQAKQATGLGTLPKS